MVFNRKELWEANGHLQSPTDELIHIVKSQHDTFCIIPSQTLSRTKSNQLVHLKQMRIKLSFVGEVLTPIQNNCTFFF